MPISDRPYAAGYSNRSFFPTGVKWLLIVNIALFVAYFLAGMLGGSYGLDYFKPFALVPADVVGRLSLWQFFTYMFLHDPGGFGHILFNMLTLWMFGVSLEAAWGTNSFLKYYFLCGAGAGVCVVIANLLFATDLETRTIGSSGAIYGLLLAFGVLFPNQTVLFSFLFPIKAKYMVMIMGGIAFLSSLGGSGSGVSHVAHLGGMIFGFAFLKRKALQRTRRPSRGGPGIIGQIRNAYREFRLRRARRKFEVYLRKRDGGDGPTIH